MLIICFDWGLERIGKKKFISDGSNHHPVKNRHCVVMFPTNGVSFGHFTRLLAIAKRMKKQDSTLEVVFFSTMPTMHFAERTWHPWLSIAGAKNTMTLLHLNGLYG